MVYNDILKGFKYIRKEYINGHWKYYYEDPVGVIRKGKFGEIFTGFKNNPHGAFKKLLKERRGQAVDVFTVKLPVVIRDHKTKRLKVINDERTGKPLLTDTSVDLVFGDDRKNVGLDHIIRKHYIRQNDYINMQVLEESIIDTFKTLDVNDPNSQTQITVDNDKKLIKFSAVDGKGNRITIGTEIRQDDSGKEMIRHFILTSYDANKKLREKLNSYKERDKRLKWYENK